MKSRRKSRNQSREVIPKKQTFKLNKFQSIKLWFHNLDKNQKNTLLLISFTIVLLLVGLFLVLKFHRSYNQKQDPLLADSDEIQNVDLILNSKGFDRSSLTLRYGREYNFRVIKTDNVVCDAIKNIELDYTIPLPNIADQFILRLPETGKYTLECVNFSKLRISVKAE